MWTFEAEVFAWDDGPGPSWRFARLPVDVAEEIRAGEPPARGWGSVKVTATIGATSWSTSVFPAKATSSFLLPVKASVRKAEQINDGDVVQLSLERT
jgi:hypothetical protein